MPSAVLPLVLAAAAAAAPAAVDRIPAGTLVEGLQTAADPGETYTLYLPSAYTHERRWPVLLVFDPRGRSALAAELFREPAERFGWIILSSDGTRSDGPMEPNIRAVNALWPEALNRFATDPERVYAAGFSGGATVAWLVGKQLPLAGIIASGGPAVTDALADRPTYAHFGAAGVGDFNHLDMRTIDRVHADRGARHRFVDFAGGHQWMPAEVAAEAVAWMEIEAMKTQLRPRDDGLAAELAAADLDAARELESGGRLLEALERYRAVVRTFDGLAEVAGAREHAARLADDRRVKRAEREQRDADRLEAVADAALARAYGLMKDPDRPVPASRLAVEIGLVKLQRQAGQDDAEGLAARRSLASARVNLAFYMPRELNEAGLPGRAAVALEVAARLDPDNPVIWYNLACARSRAGASAAAFEALEAALDHGFVDAELLASDADLDSLRDDPRFAALAARLAGGGE